MSKARETLRALGLDEINAGSWSGSHGWSSLEAGPLIETLNPTTGQVLARVRGATPADYEHVLGAAIEALTRSLAGEVGRKGVRVVGIRTNLNPETIGVTDDDVPELVRDTILGRLPRLTELAGTAVYLASDAAAFVTGTVLNVDGGYLLG